MKSLRELLIGPPISSGEQGQERLTLPRALAALSPDALSSIAYANQEIFLDRPDYLREYTLQPSQRIVSALTLTARLAARLPSASLVTAF